MLVSSTLLHQNHNNIDPFTFRALKSEPHLNQLPPTTLHYHIASNQKLTITLTSTTQTAYLQTLVQDQVIQSVQVPLAFPFDLQALLQRVSYHDLPDIFHEKFTVRLYKGVYTLFPLLKGGGGALTCAGPKPKRSQLVPSSNADKDDGQGLKSDIDKKKNDIKLSYLPERDGYPKKDDLPSLGKFYEELVENVFKKIEKENREKFQLSIKNFRKYIAGEIQNEESKLLKAKFEESFKAKKSLEEILSGMITLLREDLYKKTTGESQSEDEPLFPYEEKIMLRMINSTLLKSINPYLNEAEGFEVKVGKKILKCAKELIKMRHSEKQRGEMSKQYGNLTKTPGAQATSTNMKLDYEGLLSHKYTYQEAIKQVQLYVLRGLSWNKYSASLLVKHYNAIENLSEAIDERNRALIKNIISSMLNLYQEKEDTLSPGEINELVGLGGIQDHPKDIKEQTLFQRLLSQFAADINNDLIFDSLKTQALAAIIFQHSSDKGESSTTNDCLKQCLDVLHRQVERRLFTAENQNMQDCMDALNLVLCTMANRGAKGVRLKDVQDLATTFKDQIPSLTKNAFSLLFGNKNDPSLKIKANYAQEALKRIGGADADLSNVETALLEAAPAVIGIVSGIFTFNADSVMSGLKTLAVQGLSIYASLEKGWYDEVNKMYFLANMEFEEFEKRYFNPAAKVKITGEDFVYFISRELYKIARTTNRTYADRKKSIEWLGDIYEGKTIKGEKLSHFNFIGKKEMETYLHKCLSDLARMPQEENLSFDAGLAEVANRILGRLELEPIKQDAAFQFISNKAPDSNGLLISALKSSMTLEYAFSVMYTNCVAYYEKEIKHLDYIEIEGEKYVNKHMENKREPLWSSSTSHALDTFLKSPHHPVLLIQGDAGTGKSTFLKIIEYQQWKSYKQGSNYIPIFIRLSEILNPAKCLAETFQTQHFSHKVLEQLKEEGSKRSYLFIFDGYDELKAPKNLYEVNKLVEYGKSAKVIVTSREEYLKGYGNYIKYFRPKTGKDLLEYRITPLSKRQREIYLDRRATLNKKIYEQTSDKALKAQLERWMSVNNYIDEINRIPGLEDLIKTPYMLTIITSILPSLESDAKSRVTKANIYKVFTMKGFEVEMNRILENSKEDLPKGLDLEKSFYEFAKDLAINLYLTDRTSIKTEGFNYVMDYTKTQPQKQEEVQEPTNTDEVQRFSRFFSDDPKVKLARSGVPITMMDGQVRFNHKSIMEYFAARCFYDELKFCPVDALHKRSLSWKLLKGGTQTNQESDVLNFLKEMIEDNHHKQTLLNVEVESPQKPLDKAQPDSATTSSPTKKLQVTTPLSLSKPSAKFTASWKPSPSKKYQHASASKESNFSELKEDLGGETINKEKEDKSGVHVIAKLKDAIECRGDNKITDNFYLNVMMLISSSCPDVMDFLSKEEMEALDEIPNTPNDFKTITALALICQNDWTHEASKTNKYLGYKLNGNYKGNIKKTKMNEDQKLWTICADGQGEITYNNGDFYTGSWVNDKKEGYGVYTFAKSDQFRIYDGHWENDKFHGKGKMEFVDNSVYYGDWKEGVQDGWGEFIRYTTQKKALQIVMVYKGNWSQGQKHGTGTIYFERHRYHGKWDHGTVVEGQMEYANGITVPGRYLEDEGFKPDTGAERIQFSHEYSANVADTKIFAQKQDKENSTPAFGSDLLAQDDDGNSPVLLYCRSVGLQELNKMLPHLFKLVASTKPVHANKRGENLIHMLICNTSISLPEKNSLLDNLIKDYSEFYSACILPAGRELDKKETAEIPLLYAVERLGMLKIEGKGDNLDVAKLELIKKLTPQENAQKYISAELERMKIDSLALALMEFDGEHHQGLFIGPTSSIENISDQIRRFSDNVLVALATRSQTTLLWKLIEQKFFYLHGKNLRYILLSSLNDPTKVKPKETLEELLVEKDNSVLDAPLFKINADKIDSLPASPVNTIFKEKKQIILEEYSKFMSSLALEYLQLHIRIPGSKESYTELLNRPLFKKVLDVVLRDISGWKTFCSGLSIQFRSVEQGEDLFHHIVQSLLEIYEQMLKRERIFGKVLIWLATPQKNGIYSSPKYCCEIFTKYYVIFKLKKISDNWSRHNNYGDTNEGRFQTYKWLEDYVRFAKESGENKNTKIKPEEFKLEELVEVLFDHNLQLFQPLVVQSLFVAAIEMKDAKLALQIFEKYGFIIEKLHKWGTVWLKNRVLSKAPDSTEPLIEGLNKDRYPYYVAIRNAKTAPEEINRDELFIEVNEACKNRFYKNQLYFANLEISNILFLIKEVPEGSGTKVEEGVGIIDLEEEEEQDSLLKCLTDESMNEVLAKVLSRRIHVYGLKQEIISKGDGYVLGLFFKHNYLLYDEDYIYKCLTFQDIYNEVEAFDYRKAIIDYIVKQYLEAFRAGTPASEVIRQPNIDKIISFLGSYNKSSFYNEGNYKFFTAVINKLIINFVNPHIEKLVFLQESILSLANCYLLKYNIRSKLICDSYIKIESKLIGDDDVAEKVEAVETEYKRMSLAKGLELLKAQRKAFATECKNILKKEAENISKEEEEKFSKEEAENISNEEEENISNKEEEKISKEEAEKISKEEAENKRQTYKTKMAEYNEQLSHYRNGSMTLEEIEQIKEEHLKAETDYYGYIQQQYKVSVLAEQVEKIQEVLSKLSWDYDRCETRTYRYHRYRPNKKISPEKINILFEFFVEGVCHHFFNSHLSTKFVFEWVDRWLKEKNYHKFKMLYDTIYYYRLKFEDITPFAQLIYQKLLVLAIENGSPDPVWMFLRARVKLNRIKSWTIFNECSLLELTNEASYESGDKETDDQKLKDLNSRDKRLKYFNYDSKIVVLVPEKTDIEQETSIAPETEDGVLIVEEENDYILQKLTQDNMRSALKEIISCGAYIGDIENVINKDIVVFAPNEHENENKKLRNYYNMLYKRIAFNMYYGNEDNAVSAPKEPKNIVVRKDVGLLCKLQALKDPSYPLSEKAQAILMSPDEWDCKNYKDYLLLLRNYPDSSTDPIGWLLKKPSVLTKIMVSLDTEQKAKDFFNNFVSKNSKDPIKSVEEMLLTKVIKKHLGIIFAAYLELINRHPDTENRFSLVYKECVLEDLDLETAQELLLHLQEYPESCTELEQFVNTTLQKVEGYTDLYCYQLVKQLLKNYLSGKKTAEQTRKWIKLLFSESTVFVGASCSDEELLETLVYNLLKSMIDVPTTQQEDIDLNSQTLKERLGQVSCLFDAVMECLGYKVIVAENSGLKLTRFNSQPLLTQSKLAMLYQELVALIKVRTIVLSSASTCKGYNEFSEKTGISLRSDLDVISFLILSMQVIMHLQLIEELELKSIENPNVSETGYNTNIKFTESTLEPTAPIQYSIKDSEKSLSISYYLDSFQELPSANLFRTNTDNFCQVKSALFPESILQLYDPLLVSIRCLHDSLLSNSTDEKFEISLQQSLPHYSLFSQQNSNKVTLCEKLVYNCLYCLCLQVSSVDESNSEEKLSNAFEKAKEGTMSLLNLTLTVLGMEIQFDSAKALSVKQSSQPLCSVNDLRRLEFYLAELLTTTVESLTKLTDKKAEECVGYQDMKEKLGLGLPGDLTAFNFCVLSVSLAIGISTLLGSTSASADGNAAEESQKKLEFRLVPTTSRLPHVNYLLSPSETIVPLYYKIRKLEKSPSEKMVGLHDKIRKLKESPSEKKIVDLYDKLRKPEEVRFEYMLDIAIFSDIEKYQLSILRSKAPIQSYEYVTFSKEFLLSYCGKQEYTTSKRNILALFNNMVYNHERYASTKPEQLDKIRLLEHIIGIFLSIFDMTDDSLDKGITSKVNQYFIKDKDITPLSFLKMMISALGYDLELEKSSKTMSLTRARQTICHMIEFLSVRDFLIHTKRINKAKGSQAKACPGYDLFETTTGFSLPEECDTFSLYIFLIDLVQCLTLTVDLAHSLVPKIDPVQCLTQTVDLALAEDLINQKDDTENKCVYKLRFISQPEGSLQPMSLKEEGSVKIVNVHYRISSTTKWPEGQILEINESNYGDLFKSIYIKQEEQQQTKKEEGKSKVQKNNKKTKKQPQKKEGKEGEAM